MRTESVVPSTPSLSAGQLSRAARRFRKVNSIFKVRVNSFCVTLDESMVIPFRAGNVRNTLEDLKWKWARESI